MLLVPLGLWKYRHKHDYNFHFKIPEYNFSEFFELQILQQFIINYVDCLFLTSSKILEIYAPIIPRKIKINPPIKVIKTIKSV